MIGHDKFNQLVVLVASVCRAFDCNSFEICSTSRGNYMVVVFLAGGGTRTLWTSILDEEHVITMVS